MIWLALAVVGMQATAGASTVALEAAFVPPAKAGGPASVAVTFTPRDPDVRVNEEPAPRLKLDPEQRILSYRPPVRSGPPPAFDPQTARYLEPAIPFAFPVSIKAGAAKGEHRVKGSVTYFYCSKTAGWCRKGSAEVDVPVTVR